MQNYTSSNPDKNPLAEGLPNTPDVQYQLSHPDEYSCPGIRIFTIIGLVVIAVAVGLRFVSRKIARAAFTPDDWTLLLAWVLTTAAQSLYLYNNFHARTCYHTYTLSRHDVELQGKLWYSWNLFYTSGYPVARISLCLLYMRVFVKRWFRMACWFLIFCFAGYLVGSIFADIFQAWPLAANWDLSVKMEHTTNRRHLFLANAGFNIVTDAALLVLPLAVIWQLKMTWPQKLGISLVFCLGGLTVIASVFRLQSYVAYQGNDPNYSLQADPQWWTLAELDLGILCPCLVSFGPLIRTSYRTFSSHISTPTKDLVTKWTGGSSNSGASGANVTDPLGREKSVSQWEKTENASTTHSIRSRRSDLEMNKYHTADPVPAVPWSGVGPNNDRLSRDASGMAVNQSAALANLDPRAGATDAGVGEKPMMGTTATAGVEEQGSRGAGVPGHKIGISRDYRLERE